jgi:nucleoside-diphosphate-sugar epimerase
MLLVGAGFLGKYLLTRILEGYEEYANKNNVDTSHNKEIVYVIDKQNPDSLYNFPLLEIFNNKGYVKYFWQSMGDTSTLQKDKVAQDIDSVVITSAIADVPYAMKSPIDTYQTNVINTLQLMEYLRVNDFDGKIIHMSSESVYGHQPADKLPMKEDEIIPNPANVYGSSKLAQEQIITTYAKSYGMNATVIRSATMYGPYSRTKQAIPIFIKQILDGKPITLDGDGSNSRDFVYVEDVAHAIELALYTDAHIKGEIINVGSGRETRFDNLLNLIIHTVGLKPEDVKIDYRPFRAGEKGLRVVLDIEKAWKLLKYKPEIPMTGVDDSGIKSTIAWVANWILNWQPDEMEALYKNMYPARYAPKEKKEDNDIQVSV